MEERGVLAEPLVADGDSPQPRQPAETRRSDHLDQFACADRDQRECHRRPSPPDPDHGVAGRCFRCGHQCSPSGPRANLYCFDVNPSTRVARRELMRSTARGISVKITAALRRSRLIPGLTPGARRLRKLPESCKPRTRRARSALRNRGDGLSARRGNNRLDALPLLIGNRRGGIGPLEHPLVVYHQGMGGIRHGGDVAAAQRLHIPAIALAVEHGVGGLDRLPPGSSSLARRLRASHSAVCPLV